MAKSKKVRVYCWVPVPVYEVLKQKKKELKKKFLSDLVGSLLCEAMKSRGWIT